jgi:hypothetical protein
MNNKNLKIFQRNINGLFNKKAELDMYLNQNNYNIAILSETHNAKCKNINI